MRLYRLLIGLIALLVGLSATPVAAEADARSIENLLECDDYIGSPLDERLAQLDAWIGKRDSSLRDAEWAKAASARISIIAQQGEFGVADVYADEVIDDMLSALGDDGAYIAAAYSVGFVKIYAHKIDEALILVDRMRSHPAFDTDPLYQQHVDTLMVAIHSQTGNPILAAGVFIDKYQEGTIDDLPLIDQLKLIANISYALIKGRAYNEAREYLNIAAEKLRTWMDSGELTTLNVRRVRWHIHYNLSEILIHEEQFDDLARLYPQLKDDADSIGGALYASQTRFVEAALAYSRGEYDRAAAIIERTIDETITLSASDSLIELYGLQAKIYKAADRPEDALRSYLDGKALDDDLKAEQGRARVEYMNTRRVLLERNAQIKELKAMTVAAEQMRRRDRIIAVTASTGLTLVLFFALALMRSRRHLRLYADELESSEKKAQAAAHTKATFLANMSHEIRTPLNGLLGMTQVLAEQR